ncbi:hypothetical protein [Microcoleus sp. herbarium2]|uniref:hypothetical protein n=1 Tax=Microcoleus sp. herbarium2 TaxID=3055433 RepID=UPI002FCFAC34
MNSHIAEISSDDYPGGRLIGCRNPMLAADRAKTRAELLQATEKELSQIVAARIREQRRSK